MRKPTIDEYFMEIARAVSQRSTCLDKQVGCVLVGVNNHILATGYNGAPHGMEHCKVCAVLNTGNKNLCPAAHAEQNAMLYADPNKVYACYCTLEPCVVCTRMLMNTSCVKVVYEKETNSKHSGKYLWLERGNSTAEWYKFGK